MARYSLLGRKWPVPVAKPMAPFFAAGCVVLYGIMRIQDTMMETEEWKYDSRNPKVMSGERKPPALGGGAEGRS